MPKTQPAVAPDLVTTAWAADELGVKVQTINRWVREKRLTPYVDTDVAPARLYLKADVLALRPAIVA